MWPSRPNMSRDECRKCLRCLELDAYGNTVSVLRAQGSFTDEKKKLLDELAKVLHISNERHRAEIRRAVNDEKLSVIAEQLNGPNTCTDWAIEGRRTIPLLPRLKAHTAFTGLANSLSMVIAAANEKKLPAPSRVEESLVKAETESQEFTESDERPVRKVSVFHSETNARGKKRKRSLRESSDNDKYRTAQSTESPVRDSKTNATPSKERRVMSPLPISSNQCSNVVQVSIVTPSSTADMPTCTDNIPQCSATQLTCSSTDPSYHQKITVAPSTTTISAETNYSAVQNPVNMHTIASNPTNRQDITPNVVATNPSCAKSKANVTAIQTKTNPKVQLPITAQCTVGKSLQSNDRKLPKENDKPMAKFIATMDDGTKISRPDSTTSSTSGPKRIMTTKLCLTTKPIITSSTSRMVTLNSGSTTSSPGPGPPSVKTSTTLMYKKLTHGKMNHHPGTKMGITLNSNARLATKANVIVMQKGSSRGVTLSHGGKEVRGKVIMGGKNLCLAGPKSGNSVALIPRRAVANNGDQTLAMLSNVNLNHAESLKSGAKTGNMIVFDIRQDLLEKDKVLSQFLEASGVLNTESKTVAMLNSNNTRLAMKNQSGDALTLVSKPAKSAEVVNNSVVESNERSKTGNEPCLYSITEAADSSDADNREILTDSEERIETHGVIDAQTGIYHFESTGGTVIEDHVEETIPTSGLDIFSTALASADINLENFDYVNDEEEMVDEARDEALAGSLMTTVEQLNELSGS